MQNLFHILLYIIHATIYMHLNQFKQVPVFENCSCVAENLYHSSIEDKIEMVGGQHAMLIRDYIGNSTVSNGKCKTNCHNLGMFLFCVGLLVFFIFILKIPTILVTIR